MNTVKSLLTGITESTTWKKLLLHHNIMSQQHMRALFEVDKNRFKNFSVQFNDILLDYSKNIITEDTLQLLFQLANDANLGDWIEQMFHGDKINHTEDRAVLHVALRSKEKKPLLVDGEDINCKIHTELNRVRKISEAIRSRQWRGVDGQAITDVVNIGIGGSDLGPKMVTEALRPYALHDLHNHFVSNLDENHISDTLEDLKPETTLFIISSKSFTTHETIVNAETAREWWLRNLPGETALDKHFLAVTANTRAAQAFGIPADNILKIWNWVGGRYSLWSAIGLPVAISIGMDHFESLLEGAREMDEHFRRSDFEQNIPVILALIGIWYNNFFTAQSYAILPYDEHMHSFPAYLQQTDMESNGKSVDRDGQEVMASSGPVIFGEIGIKGQHAFYQLLHQGTKLIPADFLAPMNDFKCIERHHRALMANVFAQTEALMKGRTRSEAIQELKQQGLAEDKIQQLLPYKIFHGNKPSNTILFNTLDPKTLGALIAMYEHKVFVQGIIWNINSFDQWGVELGKQLAGNLRNQLDDNMPLDSHDVSTNGLANYYKQYRQNINA
ncbi:glucose-6-phosphate isomerase [Beggiatoa alba]|nr:glucose-6-phosphate isomerase [Beggiatoa alba]